MHAAYELIRTTAASSIRDCRSRGGMMRIATADRACGSQPGRRAPFRGETPSGPGSWPAARTRQGVRLGSLYGLSPLRALWSPDQDPGAVTRLLHIEHCPRCLARTGTVSPLTLSSSVSAVVDTAAHANRRSACTRDAPRRHDATCRSRRLGSSRRTLPRPTTRHAMRAHRGVNSRARGRVASLVG
jgi:hypothetical protein